MVAIARNKRSFINKFLKWLPGKKDRFLRRYDQWILYRLNKGKSHENKTE